MAFVEEFGLVTFNGWFMASIFDASLKIIIKFMDVQNSEIAVTMVIVFYRQKVLLLLKIFINQIESC